MFANSIPALTGDVVTEGHARYCAEHGHTTYSIDGIDQGFCPRCGDDTTAAEVSAETVVKFDKIISLTVEVEHERVRAQFGMFPWDRQNGQAAYTKAKAARDALVVSLTMDEMVALNEYRKTH